MKAMHLQLLGIVFILFVTSTFVPSAPFYKREDCGRTSYSKLQCTDSIPVNIPDGITEVILEHFSQNVTLTSSKFSGSGWQYITELIINNPAQKGILQNTRIEFDSWCLKHLVNMKILRVHVVEDIYYDDSFAGLTRLELLDLSNSTNLKDSELRLIFAQNLMPNLKTFLMNKAGLGHNGYTVDDHFMQLISTRPIEYIDLSFVHIIEVNLTSVLTRCETIETAILRNLVVGFNHGISKLVLPPCKSFKTIDISGAVLPGFALCFIGSIGDIHNVTYNLHAFTAFGNIEKASLDNLCSSSSLKHIFSNISGIRFVADYAFHIRSVSLRLNNLVYLDIEILCDKPTLETLNLAENKMEYMNPNLLACLYTLKNLDLSDNLLGLMSRSNKTHFRRLMEPLYNLINVSLARNTLSYLPIDFFDNNTLLQNIDLAGNKLLQVEFTIRSLGILKVLDLSGNNIQILDSSSQEYLNKILQNKNTTLELQGNPFTCNKCSDLMSVSWLTENKQRLHQFTTFKCTNENGKAVFIDKETVNNLQAICDKPKTIAFWSSVSFGIVSTIIILTVVLRRFFSRRRKQKKLKSVIRMIKEKQEGYEYAVFLSFSSSNDEIVHSHIVPQLQRGLQALTDEERDMVCLADVHFRIGVSIHLETNRLLEMSHAVLFIVTDDFCMSEFCTFEFQQAYQLKKRIILMIEENTNEELMPTELKTLFKQNTRIVWRDLDGECILKTSWENVCRSVLQS